MVMATVRKGKPELRKKGETKTDLGEGRTLKPSGIQQRLCALMVSSAYSSYEDTSASVHTQPGPRTMCGSSSSPSLVREDLTFFFVSNNECFE